MPRRRVAIALLAVLAASSASATVAWADKTPGEDAASARFDDGRRRFDLGDYDAAIQEFLAAYALEPRPNVLLDIAETYERMYQPDDARRYYERFLVESPEGSPLRAMATRRLRVLRALPGSILVAANRPGAVATLTRAEPPLRASSPTPHRFDALAPGDYHVQVTLADHVSVDDDIHLAPGEAHVDNVRLEHQSETLTIFSTPTNARVFLDDHEEGRTPFSRSIDTGLGRQLRLESPNYPTHVERLDLRAGAPVEKKIQLLRPRRSGRTELMLAMMAYGGYVGAALTIAVAGDNVTRVTIGEGLAILIPTAVAGVGLGFLASWALTDDGLRVGQSSIVIGSTIFGTGLAAALSFGIGLDHAPSSLVHEPNNYQNTLGLSILGGALGMGAGVLTAWRVNPSAGDAAVINSGGLWGGVTGFLLGEALNYPGRFTDEPTRTKAFGLTTFGGTVVGLAGGILSAHYVELSRGHVAFVDAGALVGLVLGGGIGYARGNDSALDAAGTLCGHGTRCTNAAAFGLGGMAIGMVAGALITYRFRARMPPQEALLHYDENDGWRFSLALPKVQLSVVAAPEGSDRRLVVQLAQGTF